ncbi:MAG: hypothetical protein AAF709_04045 [Pseudomonadota bacterium]
MWTPSEVGNAASLEQALEEIKASVTPAKLETLALEPPPWRLGWGEL